MTENNSNEWAGVFFDGGLCIEGRPNAPVINMVKRMLEVGTAVKVIAPRILLQGEDDGKGGQRDPEGHVRQWCARRFGVELPVTLEIDLGMTALYGIKCHGVKVGKPAAQKKAAKKVVR